MNLDTDKLPQKGARCAKEDFCVFCAFLRPLFLFLLLMTLTNACSIPNLETPSCTESRTVVREFYSFHFGNDVKFSADNLKLRERFLTPEFARSESASTEGTDPFTTGNTDFPKAFRVGECKEISPDRTEFQVLLFWRDDTRTEQREIGVETEKRNGEWLLDRIRTAL